MKVFHVKCELLIKASDEDEALRIAEIEKGAAEVEFQGEYESVSDFLTQRRVRDESLKRAAVKGAV